MKRLPRLLLPLVLAAIALFPSRALAETVEEVPLRISGIDRSWGFDHWERTGAEAVPSYQNPYCPTIADESGSICYHTVLEPHVHGNIEYHAYEYPTCCSPGTEEYYYCGDCGRYYSDSDMTDEIGDPADLTVPPDPSAHELEPQDFQYPTCTEDGQIEHVACTLCGKHVAPDGVTELSESEWRLPAVEHTLTAHPYVAPTCTVPGAEAYWECTECHRLFLDEAGAHEFGDIMDICLDPIDHIWETPGKEIKPATTEQEGVYEFTCSVCGATKTEHTPKLEKSFAVGASADPAHGGVLAGDGAYMESSDCTVTATAASGYAFVHWIDASSGTILSSDNPWTFTVWEKTEVVAVFEHAHTWKEIPYKAPTCTGKGNGTYAICTGCGAIVESTSSMNALSGIPEIPASGHAWGAWQVTMAPACIRSGVETRVCMHDSSHVETRTIPATGHDWDEGEVTVEPTETSAGVRVHRCKNDPTHTWNEPIPKLGKKAGPGDDAAGGSNSGSGTDGTQDSSDTGADTQTANITPAPEQIDDPGFPWPIAAAGMVGVLAVIGLIGVFVAKKQREIDG